MKLLWYLPLTLLPTDFSLNRQKRSSSSYAGRNCGLFEPPAQRSSGAAQPPHNTFPAPGKHRHFLPLARAAFFLPPCCFAAYAAAYAVPSSQSLAEPAAGACASLLAPPPLAAPSAPATLAAPSAPAPSAGRCCCPAAAAASDAAGFADCGLLLLLPGRAPVCSQLLYSSIVHSGGGVLWAGCIRACSNTFNRSFRTMV